MKYRKKPIVIEAVQYKGDHYSFDEICKFVRDGGGIIGDMGGGVLFIETPEGVMHVSRSDWVIKGISGEFYPCKAFIFAETYEEAI